MGTLDKSAGDTAESDLLSALEDRVQLLVNQYKRQAKELSELKEEYTRLQTEHQALLERQRALIEKTLLESPQSAGTEEERAEATSKLLHTIDTAVSTIDRCLQLLDEESQGRKTEQG